MATSSTTQKHRHLPNNLYSGGATSAPPPTPSSQPSSSSSDAAADTLSRLLHRLPPSLSLPTRLSPRASPLNSSLSPLPTVSLSSTSSFELGYFQLKTHSISPQLAEDAELEGASLFELPLEERVSAFPKEWPLGFNYDDDDDDKTGSFCLDGECSTTSDATGNDTKLKLGSLRELTRELEKLALEIVEKLACTIGIDNPFREGGVGPKHCSLMWVSSLDGDKHMLVYPYLVGLQYQIRPMKWDLLSDSGSVNVEPHVGSVLVTLGDIAQVWSNGKLKKVRGRPAPILEDQKSSSITMTLLLTLPLESTVSPLSCSTPNTSLDNHNREKEACEPAGKDKDICQENVEDGNVGHDNEDDDNCRVFNSFSFEDYAWRVYHERLRTKDPLDRYRVVD